MLGTQMIARPLLVLAALLYGSVASAANAKFPVPEGAYDIGHVVLRPNRTEQDHYSVKLAFPARAVLDHYRRVFASYIECGRANPPWQVYAETSVQPPRFMHQLIHRWVSQDNRELVTLGLRYQSAGAEWRDRPDDELLRVTVLHERVGDATRAARSAGSSCDERGPPPRERAPDPGPFITR